MDAWEFVDFDDVDECFRWLRPDRGDGCRVDDVRKRLAELVSSVPKVQRIRVDGLELTWVGSFPGAGRSDWARTELAVVRCPRVLAETLIVRLGPSGS